MLRADRFDPETGRCDQKLFNLAPLDFDPGVVVERVERVEYGE